MTAKVDKLRFYVDESALAIGKTLCAARHDVIHVGHPLIPECPPGTDDVDWIPAVANRGLVVIGRDKRIRTRASELEAIVEHGLRVFRIGGRRDQTPWEWLTRLVRHWDRMEQVMAERPAGPWYYSVNEKNVTEVPL